MPNFVQLCHCSINRWSIYSLQIVTCSKYQCSIWPYAQLNFVWMTWYGTQIPALIECMRQTNIVAMWIGFGRILFYSARTDRPARQSLRLRRALRRLELRHLDAWDFHRKVSVPNLDVALRAAEAGRDGARAETAKQRRVPLLLRVWRLHHTNVSWCISLVSLHLVFLPILSHFLRQMLFSHSLFQLWSL